jgi:hypothetical protein
MPAHRFGAELAGIAIDGLHVHHTCHNTICQNPRHFETATVVDHLLVHHPEILEAFFEGRRARPRVTHCKHGHEYTPDNIYYELAKGKYRVKKCRTCILARQKLARAAA